VVTGLQENGEGIFSSNFSFILSNSIAARLHAKDVVLFTSKTLKNSV